jgi:cell division protease FtsH
VQKRPIRGSYTGYGKRLPSDRPPVLSPKELALAAADGGAGSGLTVPANGQALGFNPGGAGSPGAGISGEVDEHDYGVDGNDYGVYEHDYGEPSGNG